MNDFSSIFIATVVSDTCHPVPASQRVNLQTWRDISNPHQCSQAFRDLNRVSLGKQNSSAAEPSMYRPDAVLYQLCARCNFRYFADWGYPVLSFSNVRGAQPRTGHGPWASSLERQRRMYVYCALSRGVAQHSRHI